jgi:hypothetical protein
MLTSDEQKGQRKSYKHSTEAQHNHDVFELEASTFRGPTRAINETPTIIEEFMDNSRYSVARISRTSGRRWETPNTIDAYIDMQDEQTRVDGRLPIPSKVMSIMREELEAMSFEAIGLFILIKLRYRLLVIRRILRLEYALRP